jgi:hypothetical protein
MSAFMYNRVEACFSFRCHIKRLVKGTVTVPDTSECFRFLGRLVAREDFSNKNPLKRSLWIKEANGTTKENDLETNTGKTI